MLWLLTQLIRNRDLNNSNVGKVMLFRQNALGILEYGTPVKKKQSKMLPPMASGAISLGEDHQILSTYRGQLPPPPKKNLLDMATLAASVSCKTQLNTAKKCVEWVQPGKESNKNNLATV